MIIKPPRNPRPSEDVMGPNHVTNTDPGLRDPWRNPAGDVGAPNRVAGQRPRPPEPPIFPVMPPK